LDYIQYVCEDRNSKLITVKNRDIADISDIEINHFSYSEFKINVALALKVTESLGIDRAIALQGMYDACPDPGAMVEYIFFINHKKMKFFNAFAANDPISTEFLWNKILNSSSDTSTKILLVNCRKDREDRSKQIAQSIVDWRSPNLVVLVGDGVDIFEYFYNKLRIKDKPTCVSYRGYSPESILSNLDNRFQSRELIIVGIGNIAGIGGLFINCCKSLTTQGGM
jgi:poly-gamma-glutamate synthase PgsB/CapB